MAIDIESILAPIPGDNPAGENLRYSDVYSDIKEARRADDLLDKGEWQHDIKTSDWAAVQKIAVDAITLRTKDLQIAVWLCEALIKNSGFKGIVTGINIICGLLTHFWDHLYPEIDEGDLDFRSAPVEFMNDKLSFALKEIPITDPGTSPGFSFLKWEESRQVGSEKNLTNQWGDIDETKKQARDHLIAEGKITLEEFDEAFDHSPFSFYLDLLKDVEQSKKALESLDHILDDKFENQAPRLAEFKTALNDCWDLVSKFHKTMADRQPALEPEGEMALDDNTGNGGDNSQGNASMDPFPEFTTEAPAGAPSISKFNPIADSLADTLWREACAILKKSGINTALARLTSAALSAPSVREKTRFRLIMAKVCLQAGRIDLARPIAEELYALVEELGLEKWESPTWTGEVFDTLYKCLTKGEGASENASRAQELLEKLCRTDVTKAMFYNN